MMRFDQSFGRDMQKLYTKNNNHERLLFSGILLLLFLVGALFFHPTLSLFQKVARRHKLYILIQDAQKSDFSMREYWEFREFYSPGNFTYDPAVVSLAGALQFNVIPSPSAVLLTFRSPLIYSTDSLIDIVSSNQYSQLEIPNESQQRVFYKLSDRVAYQTSDKKVHFVFVRPTSEMKQTLGLFDYGSNEDKILKNKLWLNQTTITE